MNQNFLFTKIRSTRIYLAFLILVAFTIPLSVALNNITVGLLIVYWLVSGQVGTKIKSLIKNKFFWLFSSVYLIQFLGLMYSTDVADALTKLEKKAGLILLPFLLLSMPALKPKQIFFIILAFALSSFGLVAYAINQILTTYGSLINVPNLTESIDDIIHLHHAYSGLYLVFSICSLIYFLNRYWLQVNPMVRTGTILLVLGLYGVLIILGARMALFISFMVLGLQMLIFTIQIRRFRTLALMAITAVIGVGGVLSLPSTRSKLHDLLYLQGVYHPFTPRLIQWQCCFDVLEANRAFIQGVGTGDVKPLLQACYQEKKFWGHLYNYNLHNEYLEEMIRHGVVGLSLLLLAFIYPLVVAIKQKNHLYVYFIFIFMFACLSESILNRQKGLIFYAFFNSLLAVTFRQPKVKVVGLKEEKTEA